MKFAICQRPTPKPFHRSDFVVKIWINFIAKNKISFFNIYERGFKTGSKLWLEIWNDGPHFQEGACGVEKSKYGEARSYLLSLHCEELNLACMSTDCHNIQEYDVPLVLVHLDANPVNAISRKGSQLIFIDFAFR